VTVAERVRAFREAFPDGRLQPVDAREPFRLIEIGDATLLVYVAACYRSPDDPRPGIGCAWEHVPGRTAFTRGSELQNAETSAWGRAIVAALVADARQIASADEIAAARAGEDAQQTADRPRSRKPTKLEQRRQGLLERARELGDEMLSLLAQRRADLDLPKIDESSARQCAQWDELLTQLEGAQLDHDGGHDPDSQGNGQWTDDQQTLIEHDGE